MMTSVTFKVVPLDNVLDAAVMSYLHGLFNGGYISWMVLFTGVINGILDLFVCTIFLT